MSTPESEISLEDKLTATAHAERLARAHNLVQNYLLASASIALVPVPLLDLAGITALQIKLVHSLAKLYDVPFKEDIAKSLVAALLSGASTILLIKGLVSLAKAIPVLGTLAGGSIAISGASVTYAVGEVFIRHFESGGTLLDFDPKQVKGLFQRLLKKGKAALDDIKGAVQEAVAETPVDSTPAAV